MPLTQKETMLLQDLRSQETICVEKYSQYAARAFDGALKTLFTSIRDEEQRHLNTVEDMLAGRTPAAASGGGQGGGPAEKPKPAYGTLSADPNKQADAFLCGDALSTEKHVSKVYDTCIFEFKDAAQRDALNRIQKDEQGHGKRIYDYMAANGMY